MEINLGVKGLEARKRESFEGRKSAKDFLDIL
jgi:hypothetical protein